MGSIAIDSCVFIHLTNPDFNQESHINRLLFELLKNRYLLLVDSTKKIAGEYEGKVIPIIRNNDETRADVLPLLRYWMSQDIRKVVVVDRGDALMRHIKDIIIEPSESLDRVFVYVACREGKLLVTNDNSHILPRADQLIRRPRGFREGNPNIISSIQASNSFCANGGPA